MRAGRLRHHVKVQRAIMTTSASGVAGRAWTTLCERWSEIATGDRAERLTAGREISEGRVVFVMRSDPVTTSITHGDQITYAGRVFDIESNIDPTEHGKERVIVTRERASG